MNDNDPIPTDHDKVSTLFFNQIAIEIAPDNQLIQQSDFDAGWKAYQAGPLSIPIDISNVAPSNYFFIGVSFIIAAGIVFALYHLVEK